jgi:hypothetical protein
MNMTIDTLRKSKRALVEWQKDAKLLLVTAAHALQEVVVFGEENHVTGPSLENVKDLVELLREATKKAEGGKP